MSTSIVAAPRLSVLSLWVAARPYQWIKNSLVFSGLIFSRSLLHAEALVPVLVAFVAFCTASSGIYLINDLSDREADRLHPKKRLRPLAAGLVSPLAAIFTAVVLLAVSAALACLLPLRFSIALGSYVLLNILYSRGLKRIVILDVMILASGFVLRAVAGAAAIGVPASPWLILCTMTLALLVGFGKRRHELYEMAEGAGRHRAVLDGYTFASLDLMMGISAACALVSYSLYTMAPETVTRIGSSRLVLTVPFVLFGIFRFLHLVHRHDEASDPANLFMKDQPLLIDAILWATTVCAVIYLPWIGA
jgi:4-hydroxybenzoate polyprenyltransferase